MTGRDERQRAILKVIRNFLKDAGAERLALPPDVARALEVLVSALIVFSRGELSPVQETLRAELREALELTVPYGRANPADVPYMGEWLLRLTGWLRERGTQLVSSQPTPDTVGNSRDVRTAPRRCSGTAAPSRASTTWRSPSCWYAIRGCS